MSRRITCVIVLIPVVCQCSTASALLVPMPGLDPVANLSASGDWASGRESPVYPSIAGCWINGQGHFYFAGDTAELNEFLERTSLAAESEPVTSRYRDVSLHVVIHPGARYAPAHLTNSRERGVRAQWKLELLTSSERVPENSGFVRSLTINVHVWIDNSIRLEELTVPETFSLASGGEIERFIRGESPESAE